MILRSLGVFLILFFFFSGCASVAERDISNITPEGKPKTEEQIVGEQIHRQILASFYPYTDPKVVSYVNEIGRELAAHAKRKKLEYQFTVLYNEKIYATSAPGGYIYITTGMMNFLQNEAELAAVLAHEIGEVQSPDPRFSKSHEALSTATQAGASIAPAFGPIGSLASLGLVLLQVYNEGSHKTPEERLLASDAVAMQYLVKSGYDPQALINVEENFLKAEKSLTSYFYDYYQSRPITEARMKALLKAFGKLSFEGKELTTDALEYQERTRGIREIYKTA